MLHCPEKKNIRTLKTYFVRDRTVLAEWVNRVNTQTAAVQDDRLFHVILSNDWESSTSVASNKTTKDKYLYWVRIFPSTHRYEQHVEILRMNSKRQSAPVTCLTCHEAPAPYRQPNSGQTTWTNRSCSHQFGCIASK